MNIWQKLLALPYIIIWRLLRISNRNPRAVLYCTEPIDYELFQAVQKHITRPIPVIARGRSTRRFLKERGINFKRYPSFPDAVIMLRHQAHKFPAPAIIKIGLRHGPYHFKKLTRADNYNAFAAYLMTSTKDVQAAQKIGVRSGVAVGYPKLDALFDGSLDEEHLALIRKKTLLDSSKKTVIFSATYGRSGMSAIHEWIDHLSELSQKYNILVTVHPWTKNRFQKKLKRLQSVYFIEEPNILPYLTVADVLVGDSSSIIAEYCALDRPIITFATPAARRSVDEIAEILRDISLQIVSYTELPPAIEYCLTHPDEKKAQCQKANQIFFDELDGRAGLRAAEIIEQMIEKTNRTQR